MHIKMNTLTITNILEDTFKAKIENVYSQAKRISTLKMIKVLLGQIYTVSVTLFNVSSEQMRQIQALALLPEIDVEFYDERTGNYITQNMYCTTIDKTVKRQKSDGTMFYEEVKLEFIGNERLT